MIRKHNRRAAKAAFAIALGVAIVLGGSAAAPAAVDRAEATPIIIGTKNFPEQYVLGQLYKQALEAQGFKVQYKENIGSTELIDASLRSGRVTLYPEYTGIMLSVTFKRRRCRSPPSARTCAAKAFYEKRGQTLLKATPFQDRDGIAVLPHDRDQVRAEDGRRPPQGSRPALAAFPEFEPRWLPQLASRYGVRNVEFQALAGISSYSLLSQGTVRGGRDLHHGSAADLDEVRRPQGAAQHLRLPARRARALEEARRRERRRASTSTINAVNALPDACGR